MYQNICELGGSSAAAPTCRYLARSRRCESLPAFTPGQVVPCKGGRCNLCHTPAPTSHYIADLSSERSTYVALLCRHQSKTVAEARHSQQCVIYPATSMRACNCTSNWWHTWWIRLECKPKQASWCVLSKEQQCVGTAKASGFTIAFQSESIVSEHSFVNAQSVWWWRLLRSLIPPASGCTHPHTT